MKDPPAPFVFPGEVYPLRPPDVGRRLAPEDGLPRLCRPAGRGVSVPLISSLSRRDGVDILFSFFLFSDNSNHSSKPRSFTQGSGALAFLDSARPSCYLCGQDIKIQEYYHERIFEKGALFLPGRRGHPGPLAAAGRPHRPRLRCRRHSVPPGRGAGHRVAGRAHLAALASAGGRSCHRGTL